MWEEPRRHSLWQRMHMPAACADCAMPTAESPSLSCWYATSTPYQCHILSIHSSALFDLNVDPFSQKTHCSFLCGIPSPMENSSLGPPDLYHSKCHLSRFYCHSSIFRTTVRLTDRQKPSVSLYQYPRNVVALPRLGNATK